MQKTQRKMKQRTHGNNSDYPSNWTDIAAAIKQAAHQRCARCMHPNERPWKATGLDQLPCDMACRHEDKTKQRMLTVHHLDMNKSNVAWWNLAPLCQACHLSVQARVDWHQYYMLDHSHWMAPYLKGWTLWQITGMTVVNVKLAPFTQYIGRPNATLRRKFRGLELDNPWANPFQITAKRTRERVIAEYREYIVGEISGDPERYDLTALVDHTVGCWCSPLDCHGDVLVELVAELVIQASGDKYAEFQAILAA